MDPTFLFLALFFQTVLANPFASKQSVAVEGVLKCKGKPSVGTLVKIYDTDHFTLDDWMAQSKTDAYGRFKLTGFAKEFTHINPKLNVYHNCNNDLIPPCKWKISIYIPKTYISKSTIPKVFDAGVLNLDGKFKGQERNCVH